MTRQHSLFCHSCLFCILSLCARKHFHTAGGVINSSDGHTDLCFTSWKPSVCPTSISQSLPAPTLVTFHVLCLVCCRMLAKEKHINSMCFFTFFASSTAVAQITNLPGVAKQLLYLCTPNERLVLSSELNKENTHIQLYKQGTKRGTIERKDNICNDNFLWRCIKLYVFKILILEDHTCSVLSIMTTLDLRRKFCFWGLGFNAKLMLPSNVTRGYNKGVHTSWPLNLQKISIYKVMNTTGWRCSYRLFLKAQLTQPHLKVAQNPLKVNKNNSFEYFNSDKPLVRKHCSKRRPHVWMLIK